MLLEMLKKYQNIVLTMQISDIFLNDAMFQRWFWKIIGIDDFDDVFQNAYDASNNVNPTFITVDLPVSCSCFVQDFVFY